MLDEIFNTPPDADYEQLDYEPFDYTYDTTGMQMPSQQPVIINVKNLTVTQNVGSGPVMYSGVAYSPKSRGVALVLCLLFGYFGVHCFYAGRIGRGLLFFFTFGLLGLGWIWDFVVIALGRFRDGDGRFINY